MILGSGNGARNKQAEAGSEDMATVHGAAFIDGGCADWSIQVERSILPRADHHLLILAS
jgi:hypothetical protein